MAKSIPDYVHQHFAATSSPVRGAIVTKRGEPLSVQASRGHYCTPRKDNAARYTHVEVWWGTNGPRSLRQYCPDSDSPAAYVPVEVVNRIIHYRGGLA